MLRWAIEASFLVLTPDRGVPSSLSPVLLCTKSSPKGGSMEPQEGPLNPPLYTLQALHHLPLCNSSSIMYTNEVTSMENLPLNTGRGNCYDPPVSMEKSTVSHVQLKTSSSYPVENGRASTVASLVSKGTRYVATYSSWILRTCAGLSSHTH